jgi:thiosulfate reductase/polysulfide reductase chain A
MQTVFSLCGMCATRCPIAVQVDDAGGQRQVRWIEGNAHDPSIGRSLCARGGAGQALLADDERPQQPMIRTGPRGSGQWRAATWDEALDHVAAGLKAVMDRHGGRAVALSDRGGPFTDLTRSFLRALGSPNYFDHDVSCGRNAHHATRSLFGRGRTELTYDLAHARHIVLYGRNIVESLQVGEAKAFMAALASGARCTAIDPRASVTACKANRWWRIRPNTDYALNLALIHEILRRGTYDREFVARHVTGLEQVADAVRETTPEWQEPYTGIAATELRAFVDEIVAAAPRVIFHAGWMSARHRQSFYVSRTAHILNALMGAIETKGGVILAKSPADLGRPGLRRLADRLPPVTEPRVDGAGTDLPHIDPGGGLLHRLFAALESGQPYPIGAYLAYRHDPLTALPDPPAVMAALDKLSLLVAIDVNWSETAWVADVVLPESSYLERANILGLKEGARPAVVMRDQAVPPRFDTRPAWWIFGQLAKRLGHDALAFERIEDVWAYQLAGSGVTVEQLRRTGIVPLADRPVLHDRDALRFPTPSGRIEFHSSVLAAAGLPDLPPFIPPPALDGPDAFRLLFGRTAVHTHGQTQNNPLLHDLRSDNPLWMHPERAAALGIADGDRIEVSAAGTTAETTVTVTPWIHPEAVFLLHGAGRTVPLQTRACGQGVADQRLQGGMLHVTDQAGGGIALGETVVRVRRLP